MSVKTPGRAFKSSENLLGSLFQQYGLYGGSREGKALRTYPTYPTRNDVLQGLGADGTASGASSASGGLVVSSGGLSGEPHFMTFRFADQKILSAPSHQPMPYLVFVSSRRRQDEISSKFIDIYFHSVFCRNKTLCFRLRADQSG